MSDDLKPCPFCGGEVESKFSMSTRSKIWCPECAVEMRAVESHPVWHTDDFLRSAWNTRAAVTDEQFARAVHDGRAWWPARTCLMRPARGGGRYCSECGVWVAPGAMANATERLAPRYCPNCGAEVVE